MELSNITYLGAFLAGLISFASPCVLPMLPTYSLILAQGSGEKQGKWQLYRNGISFILGFILMFVLMGATASFAGRWLWEYQDIVRRIGAVLLILMGVFMMGVIRSKLLLSEHRPFLRHKFTGPFSSLLLGMAFTVGWTPCTGPVLAAILWYAGETATVGLGAWLLFIYSLGFSLPFFLLTVVWQKYLSRLRPLYAHLPKIQMLAGAFMILLGILIWTDSLRKFLGLFWSLTP